jgi:MoxR-like ATPase
VSVDDALVQYLMRIVAATRSSEMLDLGVSPRGTLSLFRASQALALPRIAPTAFPTISSVW